MALSALVHGPRPSRQSRALLFSFHPAQEFLAFRLILKYRRDAVPCQSARQPPSLCLIVHWRAAAPFQRVPEHIHEGSAGRRRRAAPYERQDLLD